MNRTEMMERMVLLLEQSVQQLDPVFDEMLIEDIDTCIKEYYKMLEEDDGNGQEKGIESSVQEAGQDPVELVQDGVQAADVERDSEQVG